MGETDAHGTELLLGHLHQALHLRADESHEILYVRVAHAVDVEFFLEYSKQNNKKIA